jgi:GT2 family glycosyltransferase/SAM-dependent methyltransferase
MKYSIIIPTYNHCEDLLKPCIGSVVEYTDLDDVEIIVVANGCTDSTREYVESLEHPVKLVWFDDAIGYTRAVNEGIKVAIGEFVVLLNNDVQILPSYKNYWVTALREPFVNNKKMALTGSLTLFDADVNHNFIVFHTAMIKRSVFYEIGLLDEVFSPGYGEDIDFSMRVLKSGLEFKCINETVRDDNAKLHVGKYPVWHRGTQTFKDIPEYNSVIIPRNREILRQRYGNKQQVKYSIVIPTYNHCEDLLKPCIETIKTYTDLSNVEIIVVANGCVDNTRDYVNSLGSIAKLIWVDDAIGYTKATNLGIRSATGEFVVLLNNDTELLSQEKNSWLNMLVAPFADPKVGLTGPLQLFDDYSNSDVLIFFCVMIRKSLFDEIGILDEIFSPGGGEDIDFTIRANQAGYKSVVLTPTNFDASNSTNAGGTPIWHKDNKTFGDIREYGEVIVKRNGLINCKRYNKDIKLNLGSSGISYPGYLSVDMHDPRSHVHMDITKLDFDDNSVTEILASHVFEHLNPYHAIDILKNWLRVLKPGGKLIMEMPNIEALCRKFVTANKTERYSILNAVYGSVNTTDIGGPDNITSPHLFGWWPESLYDHMGAAGFTNIVFMDEQIPHPELNFRVEATKPII